MTTDSLRAFQRLQRLVMVVTTGRSGSLYVTNLINENARNASSEHEPDLVHPDRSARWYPTHTWIAETLHRIFPDARFVVIGRDGRDTALSLSRKPWHLRSSLDTRKREPGGYLYGPFPHFYIEPERAQEFAATSDLHRCIWIWRRYTEEIERLRVALPSDAQCHIRYEDLIRRPADTLDRVLAFVGETDAASRASALEAASRAHDTSIGRWQREFHGEELAVLEREAGEVLRSVDYPAC